MVVHSSLRLWMTLKLKEGMTSGTLFELCETHLLYIGNGAFGELFRKPVTSIHPQQFDLEELQETRHVFRDHNVPFMYLEIPSGLHSDIDNDDTIANTSQDTGDGESVATDKSVKKEIGQISFNIFDESYIDWIKQEKEPKKEQEEDHIREPKSESIKLANSENMILPQVSVSGLLSDHSPNCQLQLALEDNTNDRGSMDVLTCCGQNPALQVAMTINSQLHVAMNANDSVGLLVVTSMIDVNKDIIESELHVATDIMPTLDVATNSTPKPKDLSDSVESSLDTLHVATWSQINESNKDLPATMPSSIDNDILSEDISYANNIPETTTVADGTAPFLQVMGQTSCDSPIMEHSIINIQPAMDNVNQVQGQINENDLQVSSDLHQEINPEVREHLETMSGLCELSLDNIITVAQDVLSSLESDITQIDKLASLSTLGPMVFPEPEVNIIDAHSKDTTNTEYLDSTDIYYDVLTPSGDNIMYLSHRSIVQNKCIVKTRLLLEKDVAEIQAQLKDDSAKPTTVSKRKISSVSYQGMDMSEHDTSSDELVVKRSHRPGRTPSRLRIKAQQIICVTKSKPQLKGKQIKPMKETTNPPATDSDDTIIYHVSDKETWMKSDDELLVHINNSRTPGKLKMTFFGLTKKHGKVHMYKCNKYDTHYKTVSSFNIHYRTSHPPVKCKRCNKEFSIKTR